MFKLGFDKQRIEYYASRYSYRNDDFIENNPVIFRERGYLTKEKFLQLCKWKTPRSQPLCSSNDGTFIEEVTQISFSSVNERLRIEILTLLKGVDWPTASVILHFGHHQPYPILDFRALWSLGIDNPPAYNFDFWQEYVNFCRELSKSTGVTMRTLDKALWQHSEELQPRKNKNVTRKKIFDMPDDYINLSYGGPGAAFPVQELISLINTTGRNYIIIGAAAISLENHTKPQSLDFWLRVNYTLRKNTMQATSEVVEALIATGLFELSQKVCPDSGKKCKAICLLDQLQ